MLRAVSGCCSDRVYNGDFFIVLCAQLLWCACLKKPTAGMVSCEMGVLQ